MMFLKFFTFKKQYMEIRECVPVENKTSPCNYAIVLGISLNNSYFKTDNLIKILTWATSRVRSVYIMIPDEPTVHTLMAVGKTLEDSTKIARLKSNALENKCADIIQNLNLKGIQIVRWGRIVDNAVYKQSLSEILQAYEYDAVFRGVVQSTTRNVIVKSMVNEPSTTQIEVGVQFLLQELAFISHSDGILEEFSTRYVYHQTMDILRDLMIGLYSFKASMNVGYLTLV